MSFLSLKAVALTIILCMESITAAPRKPRLTIAEPMDAYYYTDIGGVSGAYSFGYDVWDPATGNTQFRNEERYPNGTVVGAYGYIDALGEPRTFKYVADERGYRVRSEGRKSTHQSSGVNANLVDTSTEASVTWTRPSKKRQQQNKGNAFQRRKYNDVQPPGFYILY